MERTRNAALPSFLKTRPLLVGAAAVLALFTIGSLFSSTANHMPTLPAGPAVRVPCETDLRETTFYDDPSFSYSIEVRVDDWDEKRREWLKLHPSLAAGASTRILLVTGSQSSPCKSPIGDHLLLRLFKNKVDYSRIHGFEIFYNNVLLHQKMGNFWAKVQVVRAAMFAHPETEWVWWIDADAVFTDMDFKPPLERYEHHNLVLGGSAEQIYTENPSWLGLNAGLFYLRNCQWSLDFLEAWAKMGPQTPEYEQWGHTLKATMRDKDEPNSDDQSAMVYLLMKEKDKWADRVYLEYNGKDGHCIQGYWAGLVGGFDDIDGNYARLEKDVPELRRRHAEVVSESYGALWDQHLEKAGHWRDNGQRPCVTHFTGCSPCNGDHNPVYEGDSCREGMERALNFADNQVLRNYGFVHPNLLDLSVTVPKQAHLDSPQV